MERFTLELWLQYGFTLFVFMLVGAMIGQVHDRFLRPLLTEKDNDSVPVFILRLGVAVLAIVVAVRTVLLWFEIAEKVSGAVLGTLMFTTFLMWVAVPWFAYMASTRKLIGPWSLFWPGFYIHTANWRKIEH